MSDLLQKWRNGLARTRDITFGRITNFFGAGEITEDTWEEIEAMLIQADFGIEISVSVINASKLQVQKQGITKQDQLTEVIKHELRGRLINVEEPQFDNKPAVIMLTGVNGSGKTTTAAKLAYRYKKEGSKVLLAAADTFRAAATEQLQVWGKQIDVPVIFGQENGDPGAVTYDAIKSGVSRNCDIVIIDTAGRLHSRYNLMEEIKKVYRVAQKALPEAPHASWLVLDATTGQNAIQQAKAFREAVNLDGIILAKLDSSAKGGMAFAIKEVVNLPIIYAGLGEKLEDLQIFDPDYFINSIFPQSN